MAPYEQQPEKDDQASAFEPHNDPRRTPDLRDELRLLKVELDAIVSDRCHELRDSCLEGIRDARDDFGQCWQLIEMVQPSRDAKVKSGGLTWVSPGPDGQIGTGDNVVISGGPGLQKCRAKDSAQD